MPINIICGAHNHSYRYIMVDISNLFVLLIHSLSVILTPTLLLFVGGGIFAVSYSLKQIAPSTGTAIVVRHMTTLTFGNHPDN